MDATVSDQCRYGSVTRGVGSEDSQLPRKRTQFLTNSGQIAAELRRTCQGDHPHQPGRAKAAGFHPEGLCEAICRGSQRELAFQDSKFETIPRISATDSVGPISKRDRGVAHAQDDSSNQLEYDVAWNQLEDGCALYLVLCTLYLVPCALHLAPCAL